jgi:hypothetical protein
LPPVENLSGWNFSKGQFMKKNYLMTVIEKNARGTTKCVYPGAFFSAQGPHRKIAIKKTLKWAYFGRIAQKGQRKMIIYLNPRTVIFN